LFWGQPIQRLQEQARLNRLSLEILARKNKLEKNVIFYNQFVSWKI